VKLNVVRPVMSTEERDALAEFYNQFGDATDFRLFTPHTMSIGVSFFPLAYGFQPRAPRDFGGFVVRFENEGTTDESTAPASEQSCRLTECDSARTCVRSGAARVWDAHRAADEAG
jgi:hypothetical protein